MNQSDIEHMAQGFPPSSIGKDHEEVVTFLATSLLAAQQKLDALAAKGMELAQEAAYVYGEYNKEMAPDVVCDGQTIQEFHDLANGSTSVKDYLNSVRADTLTRIINTGQFSNWVNQGLQEWVNRFNANSDAQLRAGEAK